MKDSSQKGMAIEESQSLQMEGGSPLVSGMISTKSLTKDGSLVIHEVSQLETKHINVRYRSALD